MRALLHLGLFVLALGFVTTADAQGRRRSTEPRQTAVVIDTTGVPIAHHHAYRARHYRARNAAHMELQRQRQDHEEIIRISRRWRQASYARNPEAKRNVRRRANAWIDREIAEANLQPNRGRHVVRLHALQRELNTRHHRYGYGRGHRYEYDYDYDYGYHYGPGHGAERKARVLDELVLLSAEELRRAELRVQRHPYAAYSAW